MKKRWVALFSLALGAWVTGCGGGLLEQPWGDTADLGDLEITVAAPLDDTANLDDADREFYLQPGEKAVCCMVTIFNGGDETCGYNALAFTLYDGEGRSYRSIMSKSSQPDLHVGDLLPGKTVAGAVAFTLPEASEPSHVQFRRDILSDTEASRGG